MVSWLQDLITSIKDDEYNVDNPTQQETKPVIDAEGNRVLDERGFTEQEVVREGKIQVE